MAEDRCRRSTFYPMHKNIYYMSVDGHGWKLQRDWCHSDAPLSDVKAVQGRAGGFLVERLRVVFSGMIISCVGWADWNSINLLGQVIELSCDICCIFQMFTVESKLLKAWSRRSALFFIRKVLVIREKLPKNLFHWLHSDAAEDSSEMVHPISEVWKLTPTSLLKQKQRQNLENGATELGLLFGTFLKGKSSKGDWSQMDFYYNITYPS